MKITEHKNLARFIALTMAFVVPLPSIIVMSGCSTGLGFLLSPGPFEKKTTPEYNLKAQQGRKILVWIECPRSRGADYAFPEKLALAFQSYLTGKAGFKSENVILNPPTDEPIYSLDPLQIARSQGAGYVLLIHVDTYEFDSLQIRNYFSGGLVTRAVLLDTDLGTAVWPQQPQGKMINLAVDMETGEDVLMSRLTAAAAHCTVRYLYPCDKLKFKHPDERVSTQEAFEMETF